MGYPNVGKSSIINSLKRSKAVSVGANPGHTKTLQVVKLDKNVQLIDSPGVLMSAGLEGRDTEADLVLRNCVRVEDVEDPLSAVQAIVTRCNPAKLLEIYQIGNFKTAEEFLFQVAQRKGKLGKVRQRPHSRPRR